MNKKNVKKVIKKIAKQPTTTSKAPHKTASKPSAGHKPSSSHSHKMAPAVSSKNLSNKKAQHGAKAGVASSGKISTSKHQEIHGKAQKPKHVTETELKHVKKVSESHQKPIPSKGIDKDVSSSKEMKSTSHQVKEVKDGTTKTIVNLKSVSARTQLLNEANKLLKTAAKPVKKIHDEEEVEKDNKAKTNKAIKAKRKESEPEEDLIGETDDFGSDELSEYEAELGEEDLIDEEGAIEASTESHAEDLEDVEEEVVRPQDSEVVLTDAEGRRYCRVRECDQAAMVDTYCRYHYLLLWKKIQVRKKILIDGKLERYVEELTARYPDKFLEVIRKDLRSEKEFLAAIQELEIDETSGDNEFEEENTNFIDEVRGATTESISDDDEF